MMPSTSFTAAIRRNGWLIPCDLRGKAPGAMAGDGSGEIKLNGEGGAFAFFAFEGDMAIMVQNDILRIGQAQAGSFCFTGKIGLEDPGLGFFADPGSIFRDHYDAFIF